MSDPATDTPIVAPAEVAANPPAATDAPAPAVEATPAEPTSQPAAQQPSAEQAASAEPLKPAEPTPAAQPAPATAPAPINAASEVAEAIAAAQAQAAAMISKLSEESNKRRLEGGEGPDAKRVQQDSIFAPMVLQVVNPMGETTWSMLATPDKVGRIIGRSGVTIKELETRSGTRIQIDHKALGEQKPVHVSGPPSNVDLCKQLIKELLENDTPGGGLNAIAGAGEATRSMECPAGIVGRIIGRGGETIRSLQSASGAHILVDQNFPPDHPRKITITGKADSVDRAFKMMQDLIGGDPGSAQQVIQKVLGSQYGAGITRSLECAKSVVGRIIGKSGETIKTLQKQYGTSIQIDQSINPCKVTIAGPAQSCAACERAIVDIIEDRPHGVTPPTAGFTAGAPAARPAFGSPSFGFQATPNQFGQFNGAPTAVPYGTAQPAYGAQPGYGGYSAPGTFGGFNPQAPAVANPYGQPQPQPQQQAPYGVQPSYGGSYPTDPMYQQQQQQQQQQQVMHQMPPSPWQELRDEQNRSYYYNSQTGVSQWERPAEMR